VTTSGPDEPDKPDETATGRAPRAADDVPKAADDASAGADSAPPPDPARRRRRFVVAGVVTAAVLVVLALCTAGGLVIAAIDRATDRQDDRERRLGQTDAACLALEQRLNRVAPPGAALDLRRRAAAVRDENAALRPFIEQIDSNGGRGRSSVDWVEGWRQLLAARITYADALDRQAGGGEPAFFLSPQTERGESVTHRLEEGARYCAGSVRRLDAPDL
jgi:hypothetical protein